MKPLSKAELRAVKAVAARETLFRKRQAVWRKKRKVRRVCGPKPLSPKLVESARLLVVGRKRSDQINRKTRQVMVAWAKAALRGDENPRYLRDFAKIVLVVESDGPALRKLERRFSAALPSARGARWNPWTPEWVLRRSRRKPHRSRFSR